MSSVPIVMNVSMGSGIDPSFASNSLGNTEMGETDWDADLFWEAIENSGLSLKVVSLAKSLVLGGAILMTLVSLQ